MHYFTFSSQDTFISSGSNRITGISEKDQNFGQDQILEVKKEFFNDSFDFQTELTHMFDGFYIVITDTPYAVFRSSNA